MSADLPTTNLQLRTCITAAGSLELTLVEADIRPLADDEVLIRIAASPINPSDIGLLIGPADLATLATDGTTTRAEVPARAMPAMVARLDQRLSAGNEGSGTVVAVGASPAAQALMGTLVAVIGGGMYARYRTVKAADCLALPAGTTAAEAASCFVNPLTALGMIGTMAREGHTALVHTAAASNLGQMLDRLCRADGIGLVNIVRSPEQARLLRDAGAAHVCDTSLPGFEADLVEALVATGATLAFDAIGGGRLAGQILAAMEQAASRTATGYSRYGSTVHKQVYIYGGLDTRPTELTRAFGMAWSIGGWLLFPYLEKAGPAAAHAMRQRVAAGIRTIFASHYSRVISLADAIDPATIRAYCRRATGEKFLIDPTLHG